MSELKQKIASVDTLTKLMSIIEEALTKVDDIKTKDRASGIAKSIAAQELVRINTALITQYALAGATPDAEKFTVIEGGKSEK